MLHDFRNAAKDYILQELERRKGDLKTQLVWIGAQKEPGLTQRTWKWVNGKNFNIMSSIKRNPESLDEVNKALFFNFHCHGMKGIRAI